MTKSTLPSHTPLGQTLTASDHVRVARARGGLATRRRSLTEQLLRAVAAEHGYRVRYMRRGTMHKLVIWRFAGEGTIVCWKRQLKSTAVHQVFVNLGIAHKVH